MTDAARWNPPVPVPGPAPGLKFAAHHARLAAFILDVLIMVTLIGAIALLFAGPLVSSILSRGEPIGVGEQSASGSPVDVVVFGLAVIGVLAAFLVGVFYFPWFWSRGGQTPGMLATGIRVVRDRDGGPVTWGIALVRLAGSWVFGAVFALGFAWVLVDVRRRGWHDLLAGTCVISTR